MNLPSNYDNVDFLWLIRRHPETIITLTVGHQERDVTEGTGGAE